MLGAVLNAFREIFVAMVEDVRTAPMRQVAELVQFAVLMAIVWVVAIGFGTRRGFIVNMLAEKREALAASISEALGSESRLTAARHEAGSVERAARADARKVLADAASDAEKLVADARAAADAEAALVTSRAENALTTEREEMEMELRDSLIEAVATATRAIMNEQMTVSEQRLLIESAISDSVGPDGQDPAKRRPEKARA